MEFKTIKVFAITERQVEVASMISPDGGATAGGDTAGAETTTPGGGATAGGETAGAETTTPGGGATAGGETAGAETTTPGGGATAGGETAGAREGKARGKGAKKGKQRGMGKGGKGKQKKLDIAVEAGAGKEGDGAGMEGNMNVVEENTLRSPRGGANDGPPCQGKCKPMTPEEAAEVVKWYPRKLSWYQLQDLDSSYGLWIQHLHRLVPGIYIGQYAVPAKIPQVLRAHGIGTIINLASNYNYAVPEGMDRYTLQNLSDDLRSTFSGWLPTMARVFLRALRAKRPIFIHCHAGRHRAPSFVVSMLMAAGVRDGNRVYRLRTLLNFMDYINHVGFVHRFMFSMQYYY